MTSQAQDPDISVEAGDGRVAFDPLVAPDDLLSAAGLCRGATGGDAFDKIRREVCNRALREG
jgi:hypothetical protein